MMSLPREVLLEISKWLSLEERMTHLAPVCRYLYNVMHDSSLWRTVCSNAEFTLHSFNLLPKFVFVSCQNITLQSLVTSLYKKNTLEILRMPNCFQVGGISLVSVVKSLPDIKIVDAGGCETISINQARDILQNCQLSECSFSPNKKNIQVQIESKCGRMIKRNRETEKL